MTVSLCTVVGARPNFMKMAPVILEAKKRGASQVFVHTGQHYDAKMSKVFFDELGMPVPDVYLGVGSGSHAEQTAKVMVGFESVLLEHKPVVVVVAGDVNSTLACALTATKLRMKVAHVESGLRSFDRDMPEEVNRVLTDHVSDVLFVTEPSGLANLRREGIDDAKTHFVGNSMIDSLVAHRGRAISLAPWRAYGFDECGYGIVTLHRPSNVDDMTTSRAIAEALSTIGNDVPLLFPIHPRTLKNTGELWKSVKNVRIVEPLGYLEFLGLMSRARIVVTDSGGIQEETTALGTPCITVRRNTERPVTVDIGTNRLVDPEADAIVAAFRAGPKASARLPDLWDGKAAQRMVDVLERVLAS